MNLMNKPVQTNIGPVPLIDFLDIYAVQNGFDSIEDMLDKGYRVPGYTHITPEVLKERNKTMKHINECWEMLEKCKSLAEAEETLNEFPNKFGQWYIEGKPDGGYTVTNVYEDDTGYNEEQVDFDWADIVLERCELLKDTKTIIKVDSSVFDVFEQDTVIRILFSDDVDETVYEYRMISEDAEGITMECEGKY